MARWDNENFKMQTPPSDIMCATCKYRLKPVTIGSYTQDRSGYNNCDIYTRKPQDVIWDHALCPYFEKE